MGRSAICVHKRTIVKKEHKAKTKQFRRPKPAYLKKRQGARKGCKLRKRTNVNAGKWRVPVKKRTGKAVEIEDVDNEDDIHIDDKKTVERPVKKLVKRK